jgi:hypothetical protein
MSVKVSAYVGLFRVANRFLPACINGAEIVVLPPLTFHRALAIAEIQKIARERGLPIHSKILEFEQPIITIGRKGEAWFPVELYPDRVRRIDLRVGTENEAYFLAMQITRDLRLDFLPSLKYRV